MDLSINAPGTYARPALMAEKNQHIAAAIAREQGRLSNFIRRRVSDAGEAEDILQDVFFKFVEAYRLPEPIEHIGAWLFQAARHRIIDRFRKKREEPLLELSDSDDEENIYWLDAALPSATNGPEAAYMRSVLLEAISLALDELPAKQRDVFIAHELDGRSFKELAAESGISINTLLAQKRYAVLNLRTRLQTLYDELL